MVTICLIFDSIAGGACVVRSEAMIGSHLTEVIHDFVQKNGLKIGNKRIIKEQIIIAKAKEVVLVTRTIAFSFHLLRNIG